MKFDSSPGLHTRRKFLRSSILGGALAWTVPGFVNRTFAALDSAAADSATQFATGRDHPILVVIQMSGGNDGLNTVVPFGSDPYYRLRPKLAIPRNDLLRIDGTIGLNPSLKEIHRLCSDGEASILQGVGYPNPNRSHFRSMEIWHTASDADRTVPHGWLGRYFDHSCKGDDIVPGISISRSLPQAFSSKHPGGIALPNPENFRFLGEADDSEMEEPDGNSGGSIAMLSGGVAPDSNPLDYIGRVELDTKVSSGRIAEIVGTARSGREFPGSAIGRQLELVAKLIGGGMSTRVFYVEQGGYDTHAAQAGRHSQLLGALDQAVGSFVREMKDQGNFDRVLLMTFSEFGRRVAENESGGTDHGAAAPLFAMGGGVKPGIFGEVPNLIETDRGDIPYSIDFRSVYASVLTSWLQTPARDVLDGDFAPVGFI